MKSLDLLRSQAIGTLRFGALGAVLAAAGCGSTASAAATAALPQDLLLHGPAAQRAAFAGRIYASDGDRGSIYVFRLDSDKLVRTFGPFSSPTSLATDASGNVYVPDWGQGSYDGHVYVTAPGAGKPFLTLDDTGALPADVAVGIAGTVYVANGYDERGCGSAGDVRVYAKGATEASYTICDSAIGQPYSQLNGVAVDPRGDVYVTWENGQETGGRVREFTPGPHFSGHFLPPAFKYPSGVAIDAANDVIVSDAEAPSVQVFTPGGLKLKNSFAQTGDPLHIVFDAGEQHLFVADALANHIDEYDYPAGTLVNTIAFPGSQLDGIAISPKAR